MVDTTSRVVPGVAVTTVRRKPANALTKLLLPAFGGFVTPFARLQGSTSTQAGFTESGADSLNLTVSAQTTNSLRTVLGAQIGAGIDAGWRDKLNVLFRRVTEPKEEWGSGFLANPAPGGLEAGATTNALTVKSNLGYKGTDPRESLLHNSQFVDGKVDMLAKYASTQWVRIAEVVVERKLVTK